MGNHWVLCDSGQVGYWLAGLDCSRVVFDGVDFRMVGNMSDDPFTLFDNIAIAMHELLDSYVRAGFTRKEGMELVKIHLVDYLTEPEESV